ncbi:MAG: ferritin family protein [Syntrophotaleaceae bacterium]
MPEFSNAFSGLAADRKVTHQELVRAIRFMIAAEYEAVQLYMQLAESTDNRLAQEVLKDIAEEEIVHAGEFLRLLKELAPSEQAFYAEGEEEVEEMMAELAGQGQTTSFTGTPGEGTKEPAERSTGEIAEKKGDDHTLPQGVGTLYEQEE